MCIKAYEYSQKFTHHGMKFEDNSVVEGVLDEGAKGVLMNLGGFTDLGAGRYRFVGTAAESTTASVRDRSAT